MIPDTSCNYYFPFKLPYSKLNIYKLKDLHRFCIIKFIKLVRFYVNIAGSICYLRFVTKARNHLKSKVDIGVRMRYVISVKTQGGFHRRKREKII